MGIPGRQYQVEEYRYGFNGKENDNEIKGDGNQQDYGMRIYDPRLGRFLSTDPLTKSFPWYTPYQFAGNTPIQAIDLEGSEPKYMIDETGHLTKPMVTLLRTAFGFSKKMTTIPWKAVNDPGYTYFGQSVSFTFSPLGGIVKDLHFKWNERWMNLFEEQNPIEWLSMWTNLIVHEGKHMNDMIRFTPYLFYPTYGLNSLATELGVRDGKFNMYNVNSFWEIRAYKIEDSPTLALFNYEDGLALKVLQSDYDDDTKSEVLEYVGNAYKLEAAKQELSSSTKKNNRKLEKKISKLEKKVNSSKTEKVEGIRTLMKSKTKQSIQKPKDKEEYIKEYDRQNSSASKSG